MLAAEAVYEALVAEGGAEGTVANSGACDPDVNPIEVTAYESSLRKSWINEELYVIRNTHAAFHGGVAAGMVHTALSSFITKGREPWTLKNNVPDSAKTGLAKSFKEIQYPKPDGVLSFDLLTNLQKSGTSHDHDQPSHLKIKEHLKDVPSDVSITEYAGPEQRFCPAGVYEYTDPNPETGRQSLVINAQNCVHCKSCSIKTPNEYILWTTPEGTGGPAYTLM
jgi:electron-transferring-flavoprotein dehydrogenase